MRDIFCLDIEKMEWSLIFQSKHKDSEPEDRSNLAMVS